MKGITKYILMGIIFTLLISLSTTINAFSFIIPILNANVTVALVEKEHYGRAYTPHPFTDAHLVMNVTIDKTILIPLLPNNLAESFKDINGSDASGNLSNIGFEYLNITLKNVTVFRTKCNPFIEVNGSTNANCTADNFQEEKEFSSWLPFSLPFTFTANKNYYIDLRATIKPQTGDRRIDAIPKLSGIDLPFAWWNTSWAQCRNLTFEEIDGFIRASPNEYITRNISTLNSIQSDADDVRILSGGCNDQAVGENELTSYVIPFNTSQAYVTLINRTAANANFTFSAYYNNSAASAPSYRTNRLGTLNTGLHFDENTTNPIDFSSLANNWARQDTINGFGKAQFSPFAKYGAGAMNCSGVETGTADTSCMTLNYTSNLNITGNNLTISFMVYKYTNVRSYVHYVGKGTDATADRAFSVYNGPGNGSTGLAFAISADGGGANGIFMEPARSLTLNTWHHVFARWNGTNMSLYLDGEFVDSRATTFNTIYGGAQPIRIGGESGWGGDGANAVCNCTIDELMIWNQTLDINSFNYFRNATSLLYERGTTGSNQSNSDTTPPTGSIQDPANSTNNTLSMRANYTVGDNIAISQCKSSLNSATNISRVNCENFTFTALEGYNTLNITFNDTSNNSGSMVRSWTSDTIAPVITFISPANSTNSSASLTVNVTITEANSLSQCKYSLNNAVNVSLATCQNTTITAAEGFNTITFSGNDSINNTGVANRNWTTDTTPPTCIIDAPANQSYNISNVSLNVRCGDSNQLDTIWHSLNQGANTTLIQNNNATILLVGGFNHLRVYANDSANNSVNVQVNATFDRIPSIDRINITLRQIGITTNVTLNASISDADNNIKNFSFASGTIQRFFSNSTLELDLTNVALPINFNLTITDNSGSTSSIPINFTYWNTTIIQNRTSIVDNLTYQVIYNNISIQNNNTARLINLTWNVTSPTGATRIRGETGNETNLNGTATRRNEWSVDYLIETLGNESSDPTKTTEVNASTFTYMPLNITNLEPVLFANVNISASAAARCRSAWDDNATVINASASTNISVYPIGCNNTNIVTIISYNITPINSSIIVNTTYNVQFYLSVNNTDTLINYSSVFANSSRIINRSIWDNQTALNFTISYLNPNATTTLAVNVSNITMFVGNISVTSSAFGASYQKYYYSANITVRENETSKTRNISLQILQSSLEHFNGRDTILDSIFVDGTSLGVALSTDSTNALINMTTAHQSGDSLRMGAHLVELTYYFPVSSGSPAGGGGGGGGGGGAAIKSQLNITPMPLLVSIAPNSGIIREVTVCNTGDTLISAEPILTGDYKNTTNVIYYKKSGLVGLQSITDETLPAAGRVTLEPNICRSVGLKIQAPNQLGKFEVGLRFQDYSTTTAADGTILIDTTNPTAPEIARFELLFIGGSVAIIGYYGLKNNAKKKNKSPRI